MRWWTRNAGSIGLVISLGLTVFGCCSETPSESPGPPAGRPDELLLTSDVDSWRPVAPMGEVEMIMLPYVDLERIIENRLRWRAYARAWELQRLGRTLDDVSEVTSG
jgi:hypothetical protein